MGSKQLIWSEENRHSPGRPHRDLIERTIATLNDKTCQKAIANFNVQRIVRAAALSRTQENRPPDDCDVLLDAQGRLTRVLVLDFDVGGVGSSAWRSRTYPPELTHSPVRRKSKQLTIHVSLASICP